MQASELILLAMLVLVLAGISAHRWLRQGIWLPEPLRRRQTDVCLVLLYLIQDVQRHRALSGAILDGRKEFKAEREATELRLQRSLRAVVDQYGGRHTIFRQPRWRVVLGHWEALRNNWKSLDFYTSLSIHSDIVNEMITILSLLADSFQLRLGEQRAWVLSKWPELIEQLGMLRALGLHAMSRNDAAASDQSLQLVLQHLRISRRLLEDIQAIDPDQPLLLRTKRALLRVEWLLDGNTARYHPYTFYEEITGVMDDWYSTTRLYLRENPRQQRGMKPPVAAHLPARQ